MPGSREAWFDRLRGVATEYEVVRQALDALVESERQAGGKLATLRNASVNLEGTYFVRQFAVFESGLRDYWATTQKGGRGKGSRALTLTRNLIDSLGNGFGLSQRDIAAVQAVREYRNALTHGGTGSQVVSLATARRGLSLFFARLPETR